MKPNTVCLLFLLPFSLTGVPCSCADLKLVPDRLVVLTFDDGNKSDRTFVGPLLKKYSFGATFFVNDKSSVLKDRERFMNWDDIQWLHEAGFEIGNHTANHQNVRTLSKTQLGVELNTIEDQCVKRGIPRPISFCYPAYPSTRAALELLEERGYLFARRGVGPEFHFSDHGDRGPAYNPNEDHPLLIPTTGASGPNWKTVEDFVSVVNQAKGGKIAVLTFHGVPALLHPWVSTDPEVFRRYMDYLRNKKFTVVALRELANYVDPARWPSDPFAPIDRRLRLFPKHLRCELDDRGRLTFSWTCHSEQRQRQSGYQILVARSRRMLDANMGDLWDSGKVSSERCTNIHYEGIPLPKSATYWWKVRAWNQPDDSLVQRLRAVFGEAEVNELKIEKPGDYSEPAAASCSAPRSLKMTDCS